ncbi:alpha-L-fucosidase [Streptosporangium roseum]|uniref:alpha-L-fucosidase n=1 Tax=Streptosporangium roseum TaxID=2001 RepID=UPI0009DE7711
MNLCNPLPAERRSDYLSSSLSRFGGSWPAYDDFSPSPYSVSSDVYRSCSGLDGRPLRADRRIFAEQWKAEKFDAADWVKPFNDAGATYFVLISKHHEGVAWTWARRPTAPSPRCSGNGCWTWASG